jgi:hypothetical protein
MFVINKFILRIGILEKKKHCLLNSKKYFKVIQEQYNKNVEVYNITREIFVFNLIELIDYYYKIENIEKSKAIMKQLNKYIELFKFINIDDIKNDTLNTSKFKILILIYNILIYINDIKNNRITNYEEIENNIIDSYLNIKIKYPIDEANLKYFLSNFIFKNNNTFEAKKLLIDSYKSINFSNPTLSKKISLNLLNNIYKEKNLNYSTFLSSKY